MLNKKIMNGENILKKRVLYILKICEKYKKNKKIGKDNNYGVMEFIKYWMKK